MAENTREVRNSAFVPPYLTINSKWAPWEMRTLEGCATKVYRFRLVEEGVKCCSWNRRMVMVDDDDDDVGACGEYISWGRWWNPHGRRCIALLTVVWKLWRRRRPFFLSDGFYFRRCCFCCRFATVVIWLRCFVTLSSVLTMMIWHVAAATVWCRWSVGSIVGTPGWIIIVNLSWGAAHSPRYSSTTLGDDTLSLHRKRTMVVLRLVYAFCIGVRVVARGYICLAMLIRLVLTTAKY